MARKRMIDPSIWTDVKLGGLSRDERLLFIGCFSNADDEGRTPGNPAFLRSVIFPYDDLSIEEVRQMRDRVAAVCENFTLYSSGEDEYIAFRRWRKHQKPRYPQPSNYPPPPWGREGNTSSDLPPQDCGQMDETFPQPCGNGATTDQDRSGSDQDRLGKDQDRRSAQDEAEPAPVDAAPTERLILSELRKVQRYPLDTPKDLDFIRSLSLDFPTLDILAEAKKWRAYKLDKPLAPKSNPRSQFRNWCDKAVKWQAERSERDGRNGRSSESARKTGKYDDLVIR